MLSSICKYSLFYCYLDLEVVVVEIDIRSSSSLFSSISIKLVDLVIVTGRVVVKLVLSITTVLSDVSVSFTISSSVSAPLMLKPIALFMHFSSSNDILIISSE